jgi:methylmalonyl-CoA/ethylmalonyl-CoA epimerase
MAFFDCGGVRIMLGVPESGKFDHPASILYYDVPDLQAAHATLHERGAKFTREPHRVADLGTKELWIGFLDDSEGNVLGIMSEIAKRE